jgi:predicted acylesterase/phospholipase RssA
MDLSKEVFNKDHAIFGILPTGEKGARFSAAILAREVKKLVKEKLEDEDAIMAEPNTGPRTCRSFVVATSSAVAQGEPVLFRSYDTEESSASECPIWKAARATSAAPSFFEAMFIDVPAPGGWFVDGGVRYNNPARLALQEAHQIWPRVKRFCLVSVGTGRQSNVEFVNIKDVQLPKETSKNVFGRVMSKVPVVRMFKNAPGGGKELLNVGKACVQLSTSCEPTHQDMLRSANAQDPQSRFPYYRFNVHSGMDDIGLEEWKVLVRIAELTRQYMQEGTPKMERAECAQKLIDPPPVERT